MYTVIPTARFEKDIKYCINTDTHSGQSNGYRILYYAISEESKIYLLTIYSKKDDNNIPSDNEIISLVNTYCV